MRQSAAAAVVAFALLIVTPALAVDDVLGWQDFRWGMTESEVVKAAEVLGLRLEQKDTSRTYAGGLYVPFQSGITLHDTSFTVRFMFLRDTRGLNKILLFSRPLFPEASVRSLPSSVPRQFLLEPTRAQILQSLTDKYGAPTVDQANPKSALEPGSVWTFATTTIRLSGLFRGRTKVPLGISYQPTAAVPKKGEKGKL